MAGRIAVPDLPRDTRVAGSRVGPVVMGKADDKIAFARADRLDRRELFGKRVHHLCEQTATNERRFGVAWTEQDGNLWFVHGPASAAGETHVASIAKQPDWCGIASVDEQIWQGGGDPDTVPALAHAGGRLVVAFERDGKLGIGILRRGIDD